MGTTILFGGTFDPVHFGHLRTARAAVAALGADSCRFIPAGTSPHKNAAQSAPAAARLAMLRLAIAGDPQLAVDDIEMQRPGPSYTIDTILALRQRLPHERFIWLLGADQLPKFGQWRRIHELLQLLDFAILARPGAALEPGLEAVAQTLGDRAPGSGQGGHVGGDGYGRAVAARLAACLVPAPLVDISATEIRQRCAAGAAIEDLVPPAVAEYIRTHGLYR
jgi:nicotinate-nucleotide adenylyltransferase